MKSPRFKVPFFIRKIRAKYNHALPPTAQPVKEDSLAHARSRLAHQRVQVQKWETHLKYGTWGDMSRVDVKAQLDAVKSRIPYWEDEVKRLAGPV